MFFLCKNSINVNWNKTSKLTFGADIGGLIFTVNNTSTCSRWCFCCGFVDSNLFFFFQNSHVDWLWIQCKIFRCNIAICCCIHKLNSSRIWACEFGCDISSKTTHVKTESIIIEQTTDWIWRRLNSFILFYFFKLFIILLLQLE